jgi:hypothetical protein
MKIITQMNYASGICVSCAKAITAAIPSIIMSEMKK